MVSVIKFYGEQRGIDETGDAMGEVCCRQNREI